MGDFIKTLTSLIGSVKAKFDDKIGILQKRIDNIPTETVLYTPQDLTDEEKQQVQENIGLQNLSKLYFVRFRGAGSSYSCDNSAADIIANLSSGSDGKLMVGEYIDFPDRGAASSQFLYLDYYERMSSSNDYKIKFTSFRTLERKGEYFGSAGFDVTINLKDSVFTVEKVTRYNTDVIYQMTKSSTDGQYHLYLNGSEVKPSAIMLDSYKNCCIDYAGRRYFCTIAPNNTYPVFLSIDSKYKISKIVLDRRNNIIEVTDVESIGSTDLSLDITGAAAGQIAKISAVDENGKPTAWEPVDMPSGDGGSGGYFEIHVTESRDTYTADKTYDEIKVAIESGLTPVCRMKRQAADAILDDVFYYYNWQIVNGHPNANAFTFNNMSIGVSRFIAIYNGGAVYYFDDMYNFYTLPIATSTTLGGVKPVAKTDAMTQDVGVDKNGKLYTEPAEGVTPDIQIGTVETLPVGSDATASMSGTAENPLLNLGIPKGEKGAAGHTPEITAEKSGKITTIKADGTAIAEISDGTDGAPGKDGAGMDITGAAAGQIAKISAVDENGKPTAWEPVDMPSLPTVNASDNGKFLRVVNGAWAVAEIQNANGEEF